MTASIRDFLILTALAAAAPALAFAQLNDEDGDMIIEAEALDVFNEDNMAVYEGRVDAVQGETRIRTDRLEAYFEDTGASAEDGIGAGMGDLERAIAIGNVFYVTPDMTATGDRAVYDLSTDTVTLTGEVVVQQGCDVLTGTSVVVNMTTGNAQVRSESGRVRTVIRQNADSAAQEDCAQ